MRNLDSKIHSPRFDYCVFLFYNLSAATFSTALTHLGLGAPLFGRKSYAVVPTTKASPTHGRYVIVQMAEVEEIVPGIPVAARCVATKTGTRVETGTVACVTMTGTLRSPPMAYRAPRRLLSSSPF